MKCSSMSEQLVVCQGVEVNVGLLQLQRRRLGRSKTVLGRQRRRPNVHGRGLEPLFSLPHVISALLCQP